MQSNYNILSHLTLQKYSPDTNYSLNNPLEVNIYYEKPRPFNW